MIMLNYNLRVFLTAAELGSLTETAKKLYITQPAVSQAIKKLETELGVRLFIRNKRKSIVLTEVGEKVLNCAKQMAVLENMLYQAAYEENNLMGGSVRIATVPVGMSLILSHVLPIYKKQFPAVEIELYEGSPLEVKNMVLDYTADIGIATSPYIGLDHKELLHDRMISVNRDRAVKVDLKSGKDDLIFCRIALDSVREQLGGQDIDFTHVLEVEAASTQLNLVENGNGTGIVSELMLSSIRNELVRGTVTPKMEMDIALIARSFEELPPAAKEMSDMILQRRQVM